MGQVLREIVVLGFVFKIRKNFGKHVFSRWRGEWKKRKDINLGTELPRIN